VHYDTGVDATKLMDVEAVAEPRARTAKEHGATRFCMGAAWRAPKDRDIEAVSAIVAR
jgi:biotin synthase